MNRKYGRIVISVLLTFTFIYSCNSPRKGKVVKKVIGKSIIEATFIDDSIADGIAKYYSHSGEIEAIANFKNGVKDGYAIDYFQNKLIKDSMVFNNGYLHGIAIGYDSSGIPLFKRSYYFGIPVGHRFYYQYGRLNKYFFSDFNKNDLIGCDYDSSGKVQLISFNNAPIFTFALDPQRNEVLNLLFYFPKPPGLTVVYKIGLTNDKQEIRNEFTLRDDRLFLDTLLTFPEKGWHYYISTQIQSVKDSINKFYFQELKGY